MTIFYYAICYLFYVFYDVFLIYFYPYRRYCLFLVENLAEAEDRGPRLFAARFFLSGSLRARTLLGRLAKTTLHANDTPEELQ